MKYGIFELKSLNQTVITFLHREKKYTKQYKLSRWCIQRSNDNHCFMIPLFIPRTNSFPGEIITISSPQYNYYIWPLDR